MLRINCIWLISLGLCIFCVFSTYASFDVPNQIPFAGFTLKLSPGARRQIQTHINFLRRNHKNLFSDSQNLNLYLSFIEQELVNQGLPTDYKYLALQEADVLQQERGTEIAGFWKLKITRAREMGIQVNDKVDERFNLAISTRQTARYLKRNNLYFKNWLLTMISLELGFKNAKQYILHHYNRDELVGVRNIYIDEKTHPFIRKFLAFKLVMESYLDTSNPLDKKLIAYTKGNHQTLKQIARQLHVSQDEVVLHNPWLIKKRIPGDKAYPVLIPRPIYANEDKQTGPYRIDGPYVDRTPITNNDPVKNTNPRSRFRTQEDLRKLLIRQEKEYEREQMLRNKYLLNTKNAVLKKNVHIVKAGESIYDIALKYDLSVTDLRKINNIGFRETLRTGQTVKLNNEAVPQSNKFESPGHSKIKKHMHRVAKGETIYTIARNYQTSVTNIRLWNNLKVGDKLREGQELIIPLKQENPVLQHPAPNADKDSKPKSPEKPVDMINKLSVLNARQKKRSLSTVDENDLSNLLLNYKSLILIKR